MNAIRFEAHGGPEVLTYEWVEKPEPATDEVLVEVSACGVNRMDSIVRSGPSGIDISLPHIPGAEVVGTVVERGEKVDPGLLSETVAVYPGLSCGTCASCQEGVEPQCDSFDVLGRKRDGGYAEYLAISVDNLHVLPDSVSETEMAALPVALTTAFRMLASKSSLTQGDSLVILGASGDVGLASILLGTQFEAQVLAVTRNEANRETVTSLGADHVVVSQNPSFREEILELTDRTGVDVAVNYLGAEYWGETVRCMAKGGTVVACGHLTGYDASTDLRYVTWNELRLLGSTLGTKAEFEEVLDLAINHDLRLPVAERYPLGKAADAHERLENNAPIGKIVLEP